MFSIDSLNVAIQHLSNMHILRFIYEIYWLKWHQCAETVNISGRFCYYLLPQGTFFAIESDKTFFFFILVQKKRKLKINRKINNKHNFELQPCVCVFVCVCVCVYVYVFVWPCVHTVKNFCGSLMLNYGAFKEMSASLTPFAFESIQHEYQCGEVGVQR